MVYKPNQEKIAEPLRLKGIESAHRDKCVEFCARLADTYCDEEILMITREVQKYMRTSPDGG